MEKRAKEHMVSAIRTFRLPSYNEIPDVGLFLEQTTKFISEYLEPLQNITITSSMISNYVKKKLVSSPVKKQYSREQIAQLFFIVIAKSVLSLEDIQVLLCIRQRTYSLQAAYSYFCSELESMLHYVFGLTDSINPIESDATDEKIMLRNVVVAVAHKVYLDRCCGLLRQLLDADAAAEE